MSGIAFISDLQLEWGNLDFGQRVIEKVSRIASQKELSAVVLLGDTKDRYNPVDLRVLNFTLRTIEGWIKRGLRVLILLGNHDRVSLTTDTESWFPALAHAGAMVFDYLGAVNIHGT